MLMTQFRTKGLGTVPTERNSCRVILLGTDVLIEHWKRIYGFQAKQGSLIFLHTHI